MFPPILIAKMMRTFSEAGMTAVLESANSDSERDKMQAGIEANAIGVLDLMKERYEADGWTTPVAKHLSMVTMITATAAVMEVVVNTSGNAQEG